MEIPTGILTAGKVTQAFLPVLLSDQTQAIAKSFRCAKCIYRKDTLCLHDVFQGKDPPPTLKYSLGGAEITAEDNSSIFLDSLGVAQP